MIAIDNKTLRVQVFEKILRVSDSIVIIACKDKRIIIEGEKMFISYLERNELMMIGNYKSIKFIPLEAKYE